MEEAGERITLAYTVVKCPNRDCGAIDFSVRVRRNGQPSALTDRHGKVIRKWSLDEPAGIGEFKFLPVGGCDLSPSVPAVVRSDYQEACLIQNLSPKAAATLARRALQGMIRDFWGIGLARLVDEIKALESKCEPELYEAMHAMRSIGNIGAHPEKDVDTIIDVTPGEAEELLGLIRLLDDEWYVARKAKRDRLAAITKLAAAKSAEKGGALRPRRQGLRPDGEAMDRPGAGAVELARKVSSPLATIRHALAPRHDPYAIAARAPIGPCWTCTWWGRLSSTGSGSTCRRPGNCPAHTDAAAGCAFYSREPGCDDEPWTPPGWPPLARHMGPWARLTDA